MTDTSAGNRKSITIDENDVALIFKEDGHVDLSFPEIADEHVPEHVMAALALSYAVVDEEFFDIIQERFAQQATDTLHAEAQEKASNGDDGASSQGATPHLKVVS